MRRGKPEPSSRHAPAVDDQRADDAEGDTPAPTELRTFLTVKMGYATLNVISQEPTCDTSTSSPEWDASRQPEWD